MFKLYANTMFSFCVKYFTLCLIDGAITLAGTNCKKMQFNRAEMNKARECGLYEVWAKVVN